MKSYNLKMDLQLFADPSASLQNTTGTMTNEIFKTTTSYKKIQSIETSKNKKEKEITQEELSLIYQEINEAFIEAMQELLEQYPSLTQDDLYYCILNYLQLSNNTIKVCMKAGSQSALTQRKYRIKKQLSDLSFSIIFDAKGESK